MWIHFFFAGAIHVSYCQLIPFNYHHICWGMYVRGEIGGTFFIWSWGQMNSISRNNRRHSLESQFRWVMAIVMEYSPLSHAASTCPYYLIEKINKEFAMESLCEKWKALPSIPNESSVVFALGLASEVICAIWLGLLHLWYIHMPGSTTIYKFLKRIGGNLILYENIWKPEMTFPTSRVKLL